MLLWFWSMDIVIKLLTLICTIEAPQLKQQKPSSIGLMIPKSVS